MPALASPPTEPSSTESSAERRGALRHPVKVPGTVSHPGLADVTVTLTDISDTGCQVERAAEFVKGIPIRLSFAGFAPVDAAIVWSSPRAYGLQFEAPIHPALVARVVQIGRGRRRSPRLLTPMLVRREERERLWHVNLVVRVEDRAGGAQTGGARAFEGTLSDLSVEGCRIASAVAVLPGCALTLTLPGVAVLGGTVRWCSDGAIGLEFQHPLEPALVQAIARG